MRLQASSLLSSTITTKIAHGTMAGVQAVVAALNVFGAAADKLAIDNANAWLQDFQHSVITHFALVLPEDRDV